MTNGIIIRNGVKYVGSTQDLSSYLTKDEATSIYSTKTELTEELATKQDAGDYALKSEIPDVSNFATKTELTDGLATKQPVGDYATQTELSDGLATKQPVGDYATKTELSEGLASKQPVGNYASEEELTTNYATKTELQEGIDSRQPAGDYATKLELSDGLSAKQDTLTEEQLKAVNSGITSEKITQYDGYSTSKANVATTLEGYGITDAYTKGEIDSKIPTKTSQLENDSNFINEDELTAKGYAVNTEVESTYLKKSELPADITTQGNEFNTGGKLVKLEIDGKLPALDGSNLINLPGGSGTSGDTIPLTNTDGTITNSKLYKGLESTDGIANTLDGYNIAYRIKDVESLPTTIKNWLTEKGATTSPAADVELATASNTKPSTGQPSVDNYALVYTTTNELKITLNSTSGSGSDSQEVYISSFTDNSGTLSLNPKYNASFRFSQAKALVPSDIIENFKIIEFADFPHIDGFDKSYIVSGKTFENRKLELQKILSNNALVSYIDNKYLRLLLNDLTPVYFAFSEDNKLQAFSQKDGNNKSVVNDLIGTTNLLAEPNSVSEYEGDFSIDFSSSSSVSNLGGTGNAIAFYNVGSNATNHPGTATKGILMIKSGFNGFGTISVALAVYFANDGIHYMLSNQPMYPGSSEYKWSGTWNTILATGG